MRLAVICDRCGRPASRHPKHLKEAYAKVRIDVDRLQADRMYANLCIDCFEPFETWIKKEVKND